MPQRVINIFEMVQIEEDHRQIFAIALRASETKFETVIEQGAIGQPGQLVEMCQSFNTFFGLFFLGDVFVDGQVVRNFPVSLSDGGDQG